MPAYKPVEQYEAEATWVDGCLIHPTSQRARKVYALRHGPVPPGICVCHTCDNPRCILDAHHFLGTQRDNIMDAIAKGRLTQLRYLRAGGFTGLHSDEIKARISAKVKLAYAEGRMPPPRPHTPEIKAKLSAAAMGRPARFTGPHTEEAKAKLRAAALVRDKSTRLRTEETKAKMSASMKRAWAEGRKKARATTGP